ncbi:MAG: divalent cation tolerance protein CutA [Novosphingobium sp.]
MSAKGPKPGCALPGCPFPDAESAEASINTVLDEGLAACANIPSGLRTHPVWQAKREEAEEVGVLFKIGMAVHQTLSAQVCKVHRCEQLIFLGWRAVQASPATAPWPGTPSIGALAA